MSAASPAPVVDVTLSADDPLRTEGDALVVGTVRGPDGVGLVGPPQLPPTVLEALRLLGATGKAGEVIKMPAPDGVAADLVVATGLGPGGTDDGGGTEPPAAQAGPATDSLRRAAGAAVRTLSGKQLAVIALPAQTPAAVAAVVEGVRGGGYEFTAFRSSRAGQPRPPGQHGDPGPAAGASVPLAAAVVHTPLAGEPAGGDALGRATIVADAVAATRDLVNTPAGDLPPAELATVAERWAREHRLDVEILDEKALRRGGYGGILGVGQGSTRPPRLVRLAYRPSKATAHLALVGKGITFDSGGLSIKPNDAMTTMKCDMAGAAAVLAATVAVARLGLPLQVTAYAPLAENMPSGTAIRPGDVLATFGGTTIEVLNTDAEGRLVLADALARASGDAPDLLVDVATLTGACVIALGRRIAAVMSPDDALLHRIPELALEAGDHVWPLPMPDDFRERLDSTVADIKNVSDRYGGALTGAVFLRDFVTPGVRWAHLDIAGPAFNDGPPYGHQPKGGTGVAVPTLIRLAQALAAGDL